ncbi:MAG: hypothetical protein ACREI9_12135, partial [Nitrospiraceae bacterium]
MSVRDPWSNQLMRVGNRDPIRELLQRETERLSKRAIDGGEISAEEFEALARLAKLVEMQDEARRRKRRWWPAG